MVEIQILDDRGNLRKRHFGSVRSGAMWLVQNWFFLSESQKESIKGAEGDIDVTSDLLLLVNELYPRWDRGEWP